MPVDNKQCPAIFAPKEENESSQNLLIPIPVLVNILLTKVGKPYFITLTPLADN